MKPERIQEPWAEELGWRLEQKSDGQDTDLRRFIKDLNDSRETA